MEPKFDMLRTCVTSVIQCGEPFLIAYFNWQPVTCDVIILSYFYKILPFLILTFNGSAWSPSLEHHQPHSSPHPLLWHAFTIWKLSLLITSSPQASCNISSPLFPSFTVIDLCLEMYDLLFSMPLKNGCHQISFLLWSLLVKLYVLVSSDSSCSKSQYNVCVMLQPSLSIYPSLQSSSSSVSLHMLHMVFHSLFFPLLDVNVPFQHFPCRFIFEVFFKIMT